MQRHNFRSDLLIEVHNGGACPPQVSEHADAAAKADTLAHSKLALTTAAQRLGHLVCVGCSPVIWVEAPGRRASTNVHRA